MEFTNNFTVSASIDEVFKVLTDAQEVAPCVPGAQITEAIDENHYRGTVKVKLGAVQMTYRGELEMRPDEATRTITLDAKGTEMRGSGGASGTFTTRLVSTESGGTEVEIVSRVDVTGRVAQFGRGIMQDVANRLIKEFAQCLEQKLQPPRNAAEPPDEAPSAGEAQATSAAPPSPDTAPTDAAGAHPGPEQSGPIPAASAPAAPARAITAPTAPARELKLQDLILDVLRSRIAAGLRALAKRIDTRP
jgi:carbon monoxide dehydrogenase subunit G